MMKGQVRKRKYCQGIIYATESYWGAMLKYHGTVFVYEGAGYLIQNKYINLTCCLYGTAESFLLSHTFKFLRISQ